MIQNLILGLEKYSRASEQDSYLKVIYKALNEAVERVLTTEVRIQRKRDLEGAGGVLEINPLIIETNEQDEGDTLKLQRFEERETIK
jgi:hypothetical protein